jgi:hypothetical protein
MAVILTIPCDGHQHRIELHADATYRLLDHDQDQVSAFTAFGAEAPQCVRVFLAALAPGPEVVSLIFYAFPIASVDYDDVDEVWYSDFARSDYEVDANRLAAFLGLDLAATAVPFVRRSGFRHGIIGALGKSSIKKRRKNLQAFIKRARAALDAGPTPHDPPIDVQLQDDIKATSSLLLLSDETESQWDAVQGIRAALEAAFVEEADRVFDAYRMIEKSIVESFIAKPATGGFENHVDLFHFAVRRIVEGLEAYQQGKPWPALSL